MPTSLAIDELLKKAQRIGNHRTKKETITAALMEYIQRRKQSQVLSLFGKIKFDERYDYKRERGKR